MNRFQHINIIIMYIYIYIYIYNRDHVFWVSAISYCAPLWDHHLNPYLITVLNSSCCLDLRIQVAFGAELQWTQRGAGREPRAPGPFHAARACPRHQLHAGRTTRALRKGRFGNGAGWDTNFKGHNGYLVGVTFHRKYGPNKEAPPMAYHN